MIYKTPPHIKIDEKHHVEEPFLEELDKLGWDIIRLSQTQKPKDSFRDSFSEVVLVPKLKKALKDINPWIEDDQIDDVVKPITRLSKSSLIEANQEVLNLILENTSVSENRKSKEKSPTVRYMDFKNPSKNNFNKN